MTNDLFSPIAKLIFPLSSSKLDELLCAFAFGKARRDNMDVGITWDALIQGGDAHTILDIILKMRQAEPSCPIPINDLVAEHISASIANRSAEMATEVDLFVQALDKRPYPVVDPARVIGSELHVGMDNQLQPCAFSSIICRKGHIHNEGVPGRGQEWPACPKCGAETRGNAIFRGILDVLEKETLPGGGKMLIVTDHKRQGNILKRDDLWEHFQLIGYAFLASLLDPDVRVIRIQIYYIRYGFGQYVDLQIPEPGEIDEEGNPVHNPFKAWLTRFNTRTRRALAYTDDDFGIPTPCDYCNLCDYHDICPIMQRVVKNLGKSAYIQDPADAVRAAGDLMVLKSMVKDYDKKLRDHVSLHGEVDLGPDKPILKHSVSHGQSYDPDSIFRVFTDDLGWDPEVVIERLMSVDKTTLKKVMNKELTKDERALVLRESSPTERAQFKFVKKNKISGKPVS